MKSDSYIMMAGKRYRKGKPTSPEKEREIIQHRIEMIEAQIRILKREKDALLEMRDSYGP